MKKVIPAFQAVCAAGMTPIYRVTVTVAERSAKAISHQHRSGATT
jgi:hypothetical protein